MGLLATRGPGLRCAFKARLARSMVLGLALCVPGWDAWAGKAHEHGVARLDVGVEAGRVMLDLEIPLDDLVGFERAPRSEAEHAAVAKALGHLQEVGRLVRVDAAAGCGAGRVSLTAPAWGVGGGGSSPAAASSAAGSAAASGKPAPAAGPRDAHADLEASYEFRCSNAPAAAYLEVVLFDVFPRLRRIEVQAVTPRGQMKAVLRRPHARFTLAR